MDNRHTWENLPSNGRYTMARLVVPGGWIYYAYSTSGVTATFVPHAADVVEKVAGKDTSNAV